jgi:hypothetical protein
MAREMGNMAVALLNKRKDSDRGIIGVGPRIMGKDRDTSG